MDEKRNKMRFDKEPAIGSLYITVHCYAPNFVGKVLLVLPASNTFDRRIRVGNVETRTVKRQMGSIEFSK